MNEGNPPASEAPRPTDGRIVLTAPSDTVQLKQLIAEDAPVYFGLIEADRDHLSQHGDTTAKKYQTVDNVALSITHPSNPAKYRFGIWDGDTMVGSDNLTPAGDGRAELGSWVSKPHTGHEYAGRGRNLLIRFAFEQLGLKSVFCKITIGNEASRRSVEKSGFRFDGEEDGHWIYTLDNPVTAETDHTKVAPTANGVAYLRTFSDIPLTSEIYQALVGNSDTEHDPNDEKRFKDKLAPQLEARYKLVDRLLLAEDISQVVELAAGIAPRGLNLATAHPGYRYVELDLPVVVEQKQELVRRTGIDTPPNLSVVSGDVLNDADVQRTTDTFDPDKPIAVVNEGLMRYLTFEEKTTLAHSVRRLLEKFGGVWITPDISLKQALSRENEAASGHISRLSQSTGIDVSRNVFDDVAHAKRFFEELGFTCEEHSFLEVSDQLVSPGRLGMTEEEVTRLNEPCVAFVMKLREPDRTRLRKKNERHLLDGQSKKNQFGLS